MAKKDVPTENRQSVLKLYTISAVSHMLYHRGIGQWLAERIPSNLPPTISPFQS
jgi:hypothetical protein